MTREFTTGAIVAVLVAVGLALAASDWRYAAETIELADGESVDITASVCGSCERPRGIDRVVLHVDGKYVGDAAADGANVRFTLRGTGVHRVAALCRAATPMPAPCALSIEPHAP